MTLNLFTFADNSTNTNTDRNGKKGGGSHINVLCFRCHLSCVDCCLAPVPASAPAPSPALAPAPTYAPAPAHSPASAPAPAPAYSSSPAPSHAPDYTPAFAPAPAHAPMYRKRLKKQYRRSSKLRTSK